MVDFQDFIDCLIYREYFEGRIIIDMIIVITFVIIIINIIIIIILIIASS